MNAESLCWSRETGAVPGGVGINRRGAAPIAGHLSSPGWQLSKLSNSKPSLAILAIGCTNPLAAILLKPSQIRAAASCVVRRLLASLAVYFLFLLLGSASQRQLVRTGGGDILV